MDFDSSIIVMKFSNAIMIYFTDYTMQLYGLFRVSPVWTFHADDVQEMETLISLYIYVHVSSDPLKCMRV